MRVAFVNDTDNRENIGCRLTSQRMKAELSGRAADMGLALDLRPCPWKFNANPTLLAPALCGALAGAGRLTGALVLREMAIAEYGRAALDEVEAADAVIYQPEGSISDDHDSLRVLRQVCLPLHAALNLSKPLAIVNGTFPLFTDARRPLLQSLVDLSQMSCLRDSLSAGHYGCAFSPDAAVTWPGALAGEGVARDHVLITTAAHAPAAEDRRFAALALEFCRRHGLRPLVLTKAWQRLEPLRAEVEALGGLFLEEATLDETEELLGTCRLHLGGRYHMALFCATKGVASFLVLSNTHKNRWLAEEFDGIGLLNPKDADPLAGIDPGDLIAPRKVQTSVQRHGAQTSEQTASLLGALVSALGAGGLGAAQAQTARRAAEQAWQAARGQVRRNYLRALAKGARRALNPRARAQQSGRG